MVQTFLDPNSKPVAPVKADHAQQLTCKVLKAQYHKNSLKVQKHGEKCHAKNVIFKTQAFIIIKVTDGFQWYDSASDTMCVFICR